MSRKHKKGSAPSYKKASQSGSSVSKTSVSKKAATSGPSQQQSIAQQRARFAMQAVAAVLADQEVAKRYRAYANSWPAMIQTNGIGQALAFAKAKGNASSAEAQAWLALYTNLSRWLTQESCQPLGKDGEDILQVLTREGQQTYQRAQAEAQALLYWIKQFARAEISAQGQEDTTDE